jgi:MFS family permease
VSSLGVYTREELAHHQNLNSWTLALTTIALSSLLIWPNATDQALIIVYVLSLVVCHQDSCIPSFVIFCGLGSGGFFSLQSSIVGQLIGSHRVSIGVGWLEVAMSFGNLAGPISAGALLDAFGGTSQGPGPYKPAIVSLSDRAVRPPDISGS